MDEEEDNVDMDQEESDDEDADDTLEKVGSRPGSKSYACRFCSESFTSELRLILHFREEHLDPGDEEEWPSESESDEGEETTPALDFMTDYERSVLKEPVFPSPNPDSEEKDCIASEKNDDNIEEVDSDPEKGEDDEEISMKSESGGADDEIEIDEERRRINEEDNAVKETDDNNDKLGNVGSASRARSRPYPCRFCSASFTSELRLILHFREEHLDSEEELLSEDESDLEDDESKEEDSDVNASMIDFVTEYERALLKKLVGNPDSGSEEEDFETDHEPNYDDEDNEVATTNSEEEKDDEVDTEPEYLEEVTQSGQSPAESPKVIVRQFPPKPSVVKTQKGDPRDDRTPRMPPRTTKVAAKKSIDKRKKIYSAKVSYECVFCDKSFVRPYLLHDHIRIHIEERPYFCRLCDKSFPATRYLKQHMLKIHPRLTPFKCTVCSESFRNRTTLKNHMTSHSAERKFECEHCKMRFHHLGHLKRHLQCHIGQQRSYECDICSKGFTRRDLLRRHRQDVHNIAHTVVKKLENFECKHCQKRFIRKTELNTHMISAHNIAVNRATTTSNDPKKEKKFECEHCKTRFGRKSDMNKHVKMFHPSSAQGNQSVAARKDSVNSTTS